MSRDNMEFYTVYSANGCLKCRCGGWPTLRHTPSGYRIYCCRCSISTVIFLKRSEAVTNWNNVMRGDYEEDD